MTKKKNDFDTTVREETSNKQKARNRKQTIHCRSAL